MGKQAKDIPTNYHIRFNPKNDLHMAAASFFASVRGKYKIAFIAAAIEAYRQTHPHGVDYAELEEIQKRSWRSYLPQVPILENLRRRREPAPVSTAPAPKLPVKGVDTQADEAVDKALAYYEIE